MTVPLPDSIFAVGLAERTWTRITAGESGAEIYRSGGDDPLYLKYGRDHVADDIADEAHRLRWLAGRLPCPAIRSHVEEGSAAWLVTTALPGRTGDDWLAAEPEAWPTMVLGAAAFLRRLHALPAEDCPFEAGAAFRLSAAARNVAAGRVPEDDFDPDHHGMAAVDVLEEARALQPPSSERVVTHGDFSLGNLLFDVAGQVTGVIDVGRLGLADPYQDIAILWQNLAEFGDEAQGMLWDALGITVPDRRRLDFHRCLDELF